MKSLFETISVAAAAAFLTVCVSGSAAAQTVLTVSGWTPPKHHFTQLLQNDWAEMVERESGGLLKIRYLPKAPMGAAQTFDGVRDGLVDISFISHGNNAGRFRLTKIAEFPLLANDAETLSVAYQRVFERSLADANEHDGVVPLAMFTPGPGHLMSPKNAYLKKASLQGQKLRAPGGMAFELATVLGAAPVSRPASELYELLNGGIVDGAFMPADVFGGWRLEDLIQHVVSAPGGFYNASFALVMNEDTYNSLSDEERAALAKVTGETFSRIAGRASDEADARGWKIYEEKGGEVHQAPDAFVEEIRASISPLESDWAKSVEDTKIDAAAALAELRAEIEKIDAE
ncbi:ABC transporter substrate-binding protein [Nitratireductor sp. StC3]|nr:ABC transporter substrate-binding protein [Nitratireductor sp. StC3]